MPRQLHLGAELGVPEWSLHDQVPASAVVTEVRDCEREAVDLDTVECREHRKRQFLAGCREVQVGRESTSASGSELAECRPTLEHQAGVKGASLMKQVDGVVLRDVEQGRIASTPDALVVAREVPLCHACHAPTPIDR